MGYAISHDWTNQDGWTNHGKNILMESCEHHDDKTGKDETIARYKGYCEKCEISEDSAEPMMNFIYPLECSSFDDDKILKVVKETNCTIMENEETGEWFLTLCGGGMDLSQDIALAYVILEKWIPEDLIRNVAKQPLLSLGQKNYKKLAREIISQLRVNASKDREKAKEWRESLSNLRQQEKEKKK